MLRVLPVALLLAARAAVADPTPIKPVAISGPYKSALDACVHAPPCGFSDLDEKTLRPTKPQKTATCPSLAGGDAIDVNAGTPTGTQAVLDHATKDKALQIRIGSQRCAVPDGIRGEQDIYFAFVKQGDAWWRSAPLWQWDYNDKYASGQMVVRWNDQPGRTFAGIAASLVELVCDKQGNATTTLELMLRIEPGDKKPIVFAPLVVGERSAVEPFDAEPTCKREKHADELTEKWSSADDLELTGTAKWFKPGSEDGLLSIGFGSAGAPSSAGTYRFTR